jgi:GT2 family glycosyltransferase
MTQIPEARIENGSQRPFWSVMIPTYNPRRDYLEQALSSVLSQDPGQDRMQIEVVDDCSPEVDVAGLVRSIAGDRVATSMNAANLGLAGNWNACISRAHGTWVHILHQDDFILPEFYRRVEQVAASHPEVGLIATRSFLVDKDGVISGITSRVRELEGGGRDASAFYYNTPFPCPGVVVRRSFYQEHGGFRPDLTYALDCEMWARVISLSGGIVIPDILASYRTSMVHESKRLVRNTGALQDLTRLRAIFAARYQDFDAEKMRRNICGMAIMYAELFKRAGDLEAASNNLRFWETNAPVKQRLRHFLGSVVRRAVRIEQ